MAALRRGGRAGARRLQLLDARLEVVHAPLQVVDPSAETLRGRGALVGAVLDGLQAAAELRHVIGGRQLLDPRLQVVHPRVLLPLDAAQLASGARLLAAAVLVRLEQGDHGQRRGRDGPDGCDREPAPQAADVGKRGRALVLDVGRDVAGTRGPRAPRRRLVHQAATTRYCSQAAGIIAVATWMKMVGFGAFGLRTGTMLA